MFPVIKLADIFQTYNMDRQTPDSAGTATAIVSGVKTNYRLLGLNGSAKLGDCEGSAGKQTESMLDWAMAVGVGKYSVRFCASVLRC